MEVPAERTEVPAAGENGRRCLCEWHGLNGYICWIIYSLEHLRELLLVCYTFLLEHLSADM